MLCQSTFSSIARFSKTHPSVERSNAKVFYRFYTELEGLSKRTEESVRELETGGKSGDNALGSRLFKLLVPEHTAIAYPIETNCYFVKLSQR